LQTLLITYDLIGTDASSANYKHLTDAIRAYGMFGKAQDSVWFVVTDQTPKQVYDNLTQHLHPNDRLFVVRTHRAAAWRHALGEDDWFQKNLLD
jgi:Flp pilus assembly CpaE family ATPase